MQDGKKYRDGLFRDFFKEPKRLLSLVNALLNLDLKDEKEIEINTIEGVFFGNLKNDLSCMVRDNLIFITEAQSTPNKNMPARMLFYGAELIKGYLAKSNKKLYGTKLVKLPAPKFFVIFTGKNESPLYETLSLKDAFMVESTLDLKVTIVNINSSESENLLTKSIPLKDYKLFLDLVKEYEESGLTRADAIRQAINHAIKNNIMSDYLKLNGAEVFNMVGFEWNEEEAREYFKQEGREDGIAEGSKNTMVQNLKSIMQTMNYPLEKAMDILQITGENRQKYANLFNAV